MDKNLKLLKNKIRKMYFEPQPRDDFKDGWCYALDWVLQDIEELEKKANL